MKVGAPDDESDSDFSQLSGDSDEEYEDLNDAEFEEAEAAGAKK